MTDKKVIYIKANDKAVLELIDKVADKAKYPKKLMRKVAQIMAFHTDENFETEGENAHEDWEEWSDPYKIWRKKHGRGDGKLLVLEHEMREGISRKTTEDTAMIISDKDYAAIHNFGGDIKRGGETVGEMPKRTFMKWTDELKQEILDEVGAELYINEKYDDTLM